jgi:hypothetical protein
MKGGRTSNVVRAKIGGAALTSVAKRKRGWLAKGGQQSIADRVWIDGPMPWRLHPVTHCRTVGISRRTERALPRAQRAVDRVAIFSAGALPQQKYLNSSAIRSETCAIDRWLGCTDQCQLSTLA